MRAIDVQHGHVICHFSNTLHAHGATDHHHHDAAAAAASPSPASAPSPSPLHVRLTTADSVPTTPLTTNDDDDPPDSSSSSSSSSPPPPRSIRPQLRAASGPARASSDPHFTRSPPIHHRDCSNPTYSSPRPRGTVRDMASRFDRTATAAAADHPALKVNTSRDRYRRPPPPPGRNSAPRSPVSPSAIDRTRLQKRRPSQPTHKSSPSAEPALADASGPAPDAITSSEITVRSPIPPISSHKHSVSLAASRPLFGEITSDGRWNGNFALGSYGPLPTFEKTSRRGSEGSLALRHGRSQSHHNMSITSLAAPSLSSRPAHERSRSDVDALRHDRAPPSMPDLAVQDIPALYPTPPDSGTRVPRLKGAPTSSRIPISQQRLSVDSTASSSNPPYSRSASAMSHYDRKVSRSPTRPSTAKGKEKTTPSSRNRYNRGLTSPTVPGQPLSAKIVAPTPMASPPLRSSRPRQPVSSATTSASRARAAGRFQHHGDATKDGRRPSEQWLGKPYDPRRERSRRKIPELDKVDFAERRARIQEAITASLKSSTSYDDLRHVSRSDSGGDVPVVPNGEQAVEGAVQPSGNDDGAARGSHTGHARGPSVDTDLPSALPHLVVALDDESPILGRPAMLPDHPPTIEYPSTPAHGEIPPPILVSALHGQPPGVLSPSVLDNVMRMREHSVSSASGTGTEFADESPTGEASREDESPMGEASREDAGEKWDFSTVDQGSIQIMLDEDPAPAHDLHSGEAGAREGESDHHHHHDDDVFHAHQHNFHAFTSNGYMESPTDIAVDHSEAGASATPQTPPRPSTQRRDDGHDVDGTVGRVLEYYRTTGTVTSEMLVQMEHQMVDLHRMSTNGGSDANMAQSLLEGIVDVQRQGRSTPEKQMLRPDAYEMPMVTPDTPPMDDGFVPGTVIVYGNEELHDTGLDEEVERDVAHEAFEANIRHADEAWNRRQPEEDDHEDNERPTPPPKDYGYTPRSSTGPNSGAYTPNLTDAGLRISSGAALNIQDIYAAGDRAERTSSDDHLQSNMPSAAPPLLPAYAPPAPPSETKLRPAFSLPDPASAMAYSERASSEVSPQFHKGWGPSDSSRPSVDSQGIPHGLPGSHSMTSFSETTMVESTDATADARHGSPGPEYKRLTKRRHIIKELLDTENSYHQDLKIIEDIYKATCTPELVLPEDKKVLFGNCDEVERFALHFYDELRKAVSQVYTPPKQHRWMNKRGSFSTTQSDGTTGVAVDTVDDEKDRTTTVGRTFLINVPRMEQVYTTYLKNHEAANQRLSAIQSTTTVKCWLDECHANASDITSAWDLDSLLVKPTQRVAKYPMLLQQLLEVTPHDHPDYQDLKTAAKDSISMLTRINDAKKRADLVEQIVNPGKRKDSDLRSGLAKAFGRRTEKLKERVGIAEAFQDPEFDDLAHKFGGHFIRLQICMRDVQDYMHRTDRAIELVNNYANALELFTDVSPSTLPEIESKFRKYGQTIRDLTLVAFGEHKADVQKRVLAPMIHCIKLHEGPQNAINKRKKKMVDYAKCKSDERRGQKPDKKTIEASDMYVALNEQLKLDLPKLYNLTAQLVQKCLHCFIDIQLKWHGTWERKLQTLLDTADVPVSVQQIEPAFRPDFTEIEKRCQQLSICNGTLKIEAASFLSPQPSTIDPLSEVSSKRRPSTIDSSNRALSVGSESSAPPETRRYSGIYSPTSPPHAPTTAETRMRSNSVRMGRGPPPAHTPNSITSGGRHWSNSNTHASKPSLGGTRPATADSQSMQQAPGYFPRASTDRQPAHRPSSDASYYTAHPTPEEVEQQRFSGLFSSALPPDVGESQRAPSPSRVAPRDMPVLFVCASLFEFSIDKTRKEGGYPYLQYVQGEVFDVVAQKGELWLAKNQDDQDNELGWIWEQHFIILSSES